MKKVSRLFLVSRIVITVLYTSLEECCTVSYKLIFAVHGILARFLPNQNEKSKVLDELPEYHEQANQRIG